MPPRQTQAFSRPFVPLTLETLRPEVQMRFNAEFHRMVEVFDDADLVRNKGEAKARIVITLDFVHDEASGDIAYDASVDLKLPKHIGVTERVHRAPNGQYVVPDHAQEAEQAGLYDGATNLRTVAEPRE